ncbi:MFS multidrug transporter-like protein [Mollisia scopiformis]|uniref:MFS multidrug transporter-like protein n=1 Tax=Mollisia scopiformis TaxID=149040 RepID=A0A194X9S5_MOLSC|nr:MFS multidrug transporter-like protein [Mollisia scopiformis]KUJ16879.1 MFS multidrug transporter-like protein [Mollisia scopiformis]
MNSRTIRTSAKKRDSNLVEFAPNDPSDPRNWPAWRKWSIILSITFANFTVIWNASGYTTALTMFEEKWGTSAEVAVLPLTLYVLGLAIGPMLLAPLSEYFGRTPVYLSMFLISALFLLGTAVVPTITGFMILRFITGFFCSASIANIGGTIADLWDHHHTGFPLSIFTLTSASGSSSGYFAYSFIAQLHGLKAVLWAMTGVTGGFFVMLCLVLNLSETRHSVILRRRAAKARKEAGNQDLEVAEDMRAQSLKHLINISLARPFHFMFTEPVIMFCAAYNGYLFGLTFLFNGAFALVFGSEGYGFDTIGVGLDNLGVVAGVCFGPLTHLWQERYYLRRVQEAGGKNVPEARVQMSMVAAVVFPVSLFWFAWTTFTSVHWIVPIIASAFYGWSFYTLILMTFMYVEDTYKVYAASALAGVCFARNIFGGVFPLFGTQMFENLGYRWAGSLLGFLALVLMPIPFILARWGRILRKRSPWAREHMDDLEDYEIEAMGVKVGHNSS